jgi:hypothetical protein
MDEPMGVQQVFQLLMGGRRATRSASEPSSASARGGVQGAVDPCARHLRRLQCLLLAEAEVDGQLGERGGATQ